MFENYLYKTIEIAGNTARIGLVDNCEIFKVHFENYPVLPGVCMIQIATELLSKMQKRELELRKISNIKFLNVVSPNEIQTLEYTFSNIQVEDNTLKVRGQIGVENTIFSKFSIICDFIA